MLDRLDLDRLFANQTNKRRDSDCPDIRLDGDASSTLTVCFVHNAEREKLQYTYTMSVDPASIAPAIEVEDAKHTAFSRLQHRHAQGSFRHHSHRPGARKEDGAHQRGHRTDRHDALPVEIVLPQWL